MIKKLIFGVLTKSTGFFFIVLLNLYYGGEDAISRFLLFWGYSIFINACFCQSYSQFMCGSGDSLDSVYVSFLPAALIALAIILLFSSSFYSLFVFLVAFYFLNIKVDYALLRAGNDRLYLSSMAFKNIFGIAAMVMVLPLEWVFASYLLGEVLKYFCGYIWLNRNAEKYTENHQVGFRLAKIVGYLKYSSYMIFLSLLLVFDRTIVFQVSDKHLVDFELLYRFADVLITGATAGLVPTFVTALGRKDFRYMNSIIYKSAVYSFGGCAAAVFAGFLWFLSGSKMPFKYYADDLTMLSSAMIMLFVVPLSVFAVFTRRWCGTVLSSRILGMYILLVVGKYFCFLMLIEFGNANNVVIYSFFSLALFLLLEALFLTLLKSRVLQS